jgi:hypothetical protein
MCGITAGGNDSNKSGRQEGGQADSDSDDANRFTS